MKTYKEFIEDPEEQLVYVRGYGQLLRRQARVIAIEKLAKLSDSLSKKQKITPIDLDDVKIFIDAI